jgi:hypothetical protein
MVNVIGRWPITHVLSLPEHRPALPMSGADYLPDYIAALILAIFSFVVAGAWSMVDRKRVHDRSLFVWTYTVVRYVLAALLLFYGWDKLLPGQFGDGVNLEKVVPSAAQLTPMALLWAFMSASRAYAMFTGAIECSAGFLLLSRRTTLLGALIGCAAIGNVLALNLAYDVNVKFVAGLMLLMTAFLIAPHATALWRMFVLHQPTQVGVLPLLFTDVRRDRVARGAGVLVAISVTYWAHQRAQAVVDMNASNAKSPFYGVWSVDETGGTGVDTRFVAVRQQWRRLVFPFGDNGVLFAVSQSDSVTQYRMNVSREANTLELRSMPVSDEGTARHPSYRFSFPDREHLELRRLTESDTPTLVRLQRVNESDFPLVRHKHEWTW